LRDSSLALVCKITDEIRETFTWNCRCWHKTNIFLDVRILPVKTRVESLFSKCKHGFAQSIIELIQWVLLLQLEGVSCVIVFFGFPLINTINFVQSNDKWAFLLS
jgi:hypothetical protein